MTECGSGARAEHDQLATKVVCPGSSILESENSPTWASPDGFEPRKGFRRFVAERKGPAQKNLRWTGRDLNPRNLRQPVVWAEEGLGQSLWRFSVRFG